MPESTCDSADVGTDELVLDSQDSEVESPIQTNELNLSFTELSASEESDGDSESDDNLSANVNHSLSAPDVKTHSGPDWSLQFKDFELGSHFDKNIVTSLEALENISKQIDAPSVEKKSQAETVRLKRAELLSKLKRKVHPDYIDLLIKENNSQQFQDWHFLRNNATFIQCDIWQEFIGKRKKQTMPLEELMLAFGVPSELLDPHFKIEDISQYDPLNKLVPVDVMCDELVKYINDPRFTQYFILFILDRKIFQSIECTTDWCTRVFNSISLSKFINTYLDVVPRDCFFLHFRTIRQIPQMQELLLTCLFEKISQDTLVARLKDLLSARQYQEALYFTLLIYGSTYMPFGKTRTSEHLSSYLFDQYDDGNHVELTIIRSYINLFMKIK
ncbi:LAFE_0F17084g1_1 [Lachancea fermentati]|uniref:LAFE_0F17084g1_1 n=1 Tax=Lachancea fermentati TaxID=4955 RepID=A0A1G4MGC5_LACFM|nr:LAFE_0F17084g1_1 [Lachancea fermentati]